MRVPLRGGLALALALAASVSPSACAVSGLSFRRDDRVDIVAPRDRQAVRLPITIDWTVRDFDGTYAVFVDRAPQPPNRTVAWLFRNDDSCRASDGCPTPAFLADRSIYLTEETELTLDHLPDTQRDDRREFHEAVVVLLDDEGKRVGESAFTVEFQVERDQ